MGGGGGGGGGGVTSTKAKLSFSKLEWNANVTLRTNSGR